MARYRGYGFALGVDSSHQAIDPGGAARYRISVEPIGGVAGPATLLAASPSPSLTLGLAPDTFTPLGRAVLTVTDTHAGPWLLPGLWHTLPTTGTGGDFTKSTVVTLLVGGARAYLPLLSRE